MRIKATYLAKLFQLSIESYDSVKDFGDIAKLAIWEVNKNYRVLDYDNKEKEHVHYIKSHKTLLLWFCTYRINNFLVNPSSRRSKADLPKFLAENLDMVTKIIHHCKQK